MFARVTKYHAEEDANRLLEAFKDTMGSLQIVPGFSHGYFLIDRSTGAAVSMTIWESEKAMSASTESAEGRRREREEVGRAKVEAVENYEIGLIASAPDVEPAGRRVAEPVAEPGEDDEV